MTALVMRKHQFPRQVSQSDLEAEFLKGRSVLVNGASWNNISNIIAKFRRRKVTVHSQRMGMDSFLIWAE